MRIVAADWSSDLDEVRALFDEYARGLDVDLSFQDFHAERAALPGQYRPPEGRLLLARDDADRVVGCVALRRLDDARGEIKRLYVRPEGRSSGLGRRLVERICDEARAAGYQRICLDTLPSMTAAIGLYRSLGFEPIAPYVYNPVPGAQFLGLTLGDTAAS